MGAAYGTAKSGVGIASMGVMRPELVMKSIVPVVMAGVLGIYGLIIAVIISTGGEFMPFSFGQENCVTSKRSTLPSELPCTGLLPPFAPSSLPLDRSFIDQFVPVLLLQSTPPATGSTMVSLTWLPVWLAVWLVSLPVWLLASSATLVSGKWPCLFSTWPFAQLYLRCDAQTRTYTGSQRERPAAQALRRHDSDSHFR